MNFAHKFQNEFNSTLFYSVPSFSSFSIYLCQNNSNTILQHSYDWTWIAEQYIYTLMHYFAFAFNKFMLVWMCVCGMCAYIWKCHSMCHFRISMYDLEKCILHTHSCSTAISQMHLSSRPYVLVRKLIRKLTSSLCEWFICTIFDSVRHEIAIFRCVYFRFALLFHFLGIFFLLILTHTACVMI